MGLSFCIVCGEDISDFGGAKCCDCKELACEECSFSCKKCGKSVCDRCARQCKECSDIYCDKHYVAHMKKIHGKTVKLKKKAPRRKKSKATKR